MFSKFREILFEDFEDHLLHIPAGVPEEMRLAEGLTS